MIVCNSGVNGGDIFDAESRILVIDTEPGFHFRKKKRARSELRL